MDENEGWKPMKLMRNGDYDLEAATKEAQGFASAMGWEIKPGSVKVESAEPIEIDGKVNHTRSKITFSGRLA